MPQNNNKHAQQQKKKQKGRAPAHQNTFAFKHNPKSKKTAKILELPNQHVCRRCYDKIEWRKKYRKYKPRTQPGKCNFCCQRNVMAAYHNICNKCSLSEKAIQAVEQHMTAANTAATAAENEKDNNYDNGNHSVQLEPNDLREEEEEEDMEHPTQQSEEDDKSNDNNQKKEQQKEEDGQERQRRRRACAMCVKEFALPCPDDNIDDENDIDLKLKSGKRLTLRQRKTLERQKAAAAAQKNSKKTDKRIQNYEGDNDPAADEDDDHPSLSADEEEMDADTDDEDESEEEEEDPFLRAVGGKGRLLVGEAYQQSLLQKQMASTTI